MKLLQRALGPATLVTLLGTFIMGMWVTPKATMLDGGGDLVRMLYVHPAVAWVALYVSFGTTTVASALYLWRRTRSVVMDRIAYCAMEVSALFIFLTLVTGSIWGRPAWGVWWAWDARLTSTAILGVFVLGYLALRRANDDPEARARRSAVFGILIALDIPIIHFAVVWWKTLHQSATVLNSTGNVLVHGSMLWTLLLSFVAFTLLFVWLLRFRYRLEVMRETSQQSRRDVAVAARQREGA
jgi:heme exporter protein C